ncbi:MAG TPA: hypothetical protein VGX22_03705 [Candidatus Dormibacteraeota bacterium]|nr:hypothetical protein [Candidatus Dormibacteraeota bacterium]
MKARRNRTDRGAERRRNLAEVNLLSEHRTRQTTARARGCALPFIGALVVAALPLAMWLR